MAKIAYTALSDSMRLGVLYPYIRPIYFLMYTFDAYGCSQFDVNKFDTPPRVPNKGIYNVKLAEVGSVTLGYVECVLYIWYLIVSAVQRLTARCHRAGLHE